MRQVKFFIPTMLPKMPPGNRKIAYPQAKAERTMSPLIVCIFISEVYLKVKSTIDRKKDF